MTNYKEMMNGKREIPISSCPSHIEDLVYGTGPVLHSPGEETTVAFEQSTEQVPSVKKGKKAVESEKARNLKDLKRKCGFDAAISYCTVDTENCFNYRGNKYRIADNVSAYAPKETPLGKLYDMDKIVCAKTKDGVLFFFTADYDQIDPEDICKIF